MEPQVTTPDPKTRVTAAAEAQPSSGILAQGTACKLCPATTSRCVGLEFRGWQGWTQGLG